MCGKDTVGNDRRRQTVSLWAMCKTPPPRHPHHLGSARMPAHNQISYQLSVRKPPNVMNRQNYFNFIEKQLSCLAFRLEVRGGLNILDLNLHSENFYLQFLKVLFGWELKNLNTVRQNAAGIDLVDTTNKIIVQVSSTATKQKIESALGKNLSKYTGYSFKFVSICKDVKDLRKQAFSNPHHLGFTPADDIYDIPSLLKNINAMEIGQMKQVYEFLKKELKCEPDPDKVESNLATIITVLSKVDWAQVPTSFEIIPYDIEAKIAHNRLDTVRSIIEDYKIHYGRIAKIYSDFDKQGVNKSTSILNGIRAEYLAVGTTGSPDQSFLSVIEKVVEKIRASANYVPLPEEELLLSVQILVVDAFIRCKIFKNPLGQTDARA